MYLIRGGPAEPSASQGPGASQGPKAGKGPSAGLLLTEPLRGLGDHIAAGLLAVPGLVAAPRGDGHGVLVFPGLLAGDGSTVPLRGFLRWLGYQVRGWDLGRNHGPTEAVLAGLPQALFDHAERTGRPVSLVGWSLGGIYAREMARRHPRHVRQVITLGTPYARMDPTGRRRSRPIGVPSTSVYSRLDGVVAWQACVEPETAIHQNVEVRCSHLGFGVDPATLWLIADRLAVPAGQRVPFRPPLALRFLYPSATGHQR